MRRDGVDQPIEQIVTEVLLDIQEHLVRCRFSLTDFQLPILDSTDLRNRGTTEMQEKHVMILVPCNIPCRATLLS